MNDNKQEEYLIPYKYAEIELIEKKSRFISRIWHIETEEQALEKINAIRTKHWDATHNVYVYIIRDGNIMRYSDDGEPQGTSGLPTLNVFKNENIENVCCITTRYFGRILLGAGGLVRAYSKAAKIALDKAGISVMRKWHVVFIPCEYNLFERLKSDLVNFEAIINTIDFSANVKLKILLPLKNTEIFQKYLQDLSAGTIKMEIIKTVFKAAKIK